MPVPGSRSVHLVGGGWTRAGVDAVYGPLASACSGPIALMVEAGLEIGKDLGTYLYPKGFR